MNTDYKGFRLYDDWLRLKRKGGSIDIFFEKNGYRRIAVYGLGLIGKQLVEELEGSDIKVVFGIDIKGEEIDVAGLDVLKPEQIIDDGRETDAVVVTAMMSFYEIERNLIEIGYNKDIISIEDVIWSCK